MKPRARIYNDSPSTKDLPSTNFSVDSHSSDAKTNLTVNLLADRHLNGEHNVMKLKKYVRMNK